MTNERIFRRFIVLTGIWFLLMFLGNTELIQVSASADSQTVAATQKSASKRKGWYTTRKGNRYYYKKGKVVTGVQKINGTLYYFSRAGRLQIGNNKWITVGKKTYYLLSSGTLKTGWMELDGKRYYLNKKGVRQTGWTTINKVKYYFNNNGVLLTNKNLRIGTTRYLLGSDGTLASKGFHQVGRYTYYVKKNGTLKIGWLKYKNNWYYFHKNGTMARGLKKIGKYTYYLDNNGVRQTGIQKIGNYYYFFHMKNGTMRTGWRTCNGRKYYFSRSNTATNPKGTMLHSTWLKYKGYYYYLQANGVMARKWLCIDGKYYYFNIKVNGKKPVGSRATGWLKSSGNQYYLSKKGVRQSGWKTISGNRYYFDGNGIMRTGWVTVDGKQYYMNTAGILQKNKWIDSTHYVGSDGAWIQGYGESVSTVTGWRWPLDSKWNTISSYFGNRSSPGGVGSTNHKGIDIPATKGSPIYAVYAGTVVVKQGTSASGGFGNWVQINHGGGLITEYAHMSSFASGIAVGTRVVKGQVIGYVGSTGNSTGNHLHFGVVYNGTRVDPMNYLKKP